MKIILLIFAAVRILHCCELTCENCGFPVVSEAITASVIKLNEISTIDNCFSVTKHKVDAILPLEEHFLQVNLTIDVWETICLKDARNESVKCQLKPLPDAETATCTSWVMLDKGEIQSVEIECRNTNLTTTIVPVTSEPITSTPAPTLLTTPTTTSIPTSTSTPTLSSIQSSLEKNKSSEKNCKHERNQHCTTKLGSKGHGWNGRKQYPEQEKHISVGRNPIWRRGKDRKVKRNPKQGKRNPVGRKPKWKRRRGNPRGNLQIKLATQKKLGMI
ncbi:uncharacterized protein [Heterodontus francisci]|uniref:uncharacterized protein isoform X2 n=1 Tax=Heterodontus francisci TaxID=7792 RepID=UPI00355B9AEC